MSTTVSSEELEIIKKGLIVLCADYKSRVCRYEYILKDSDVFCNVADEKYIKTVINELSDNLKEFCELKERISTVLSENDLEIAKHSLEDLRSWYVNRNYGLNALLKESVQNHDDCSERGLYSDIKENSKKIEEIDTILERLKR